LTTPCEIAKNLEKLTSTFLDLERPTKFWKVRETSITDFIIASFKIRMKYKWVEVDASHEATTNADFEVILRQGGRDLTFLIQAKRTEFTKSGTLIAPEVFHPQTSGEQNKNLIEFANNNKMAALYSFFLSSNGKDHLKHKVSPPITGIMLEYATEIRNIGFRKPVNNIKKCTSLLNGSFPFHRLFCLAQKNRELESVIGGINEYSKRRGSKARLTHDIITEKISLIERRKRDRDGRSYREVDTFEGFETFRILLNMDEL
jgi:uncharacterized protein DUF6615